VLALLPLTAQNGSEIKHLTVGPVVSRGAVVPKIHLAAKSIEQSAEIVYLKRSVEINLGMFGCMLSDNGNPKWKSRFMRRTYK
jgi:hypothetical protein